MFHVPNNPTLPYKIEICFPIVQRPLREFLTVLFARKLKFNAEQLSQLVRCVLRSSGEKKSGPKADVRMCMCALYSRVLGKRHVNIIEER